MPLPRTVLTALSVAQSGSPRTGPGASARGLPSQGGEMPRVVCFPRADGDFAARVQAILEGSPPEGPFESAVQALLRESHPLAVISPRQELGAIDGTRVWYAFRDGSMVPAADEDPS